MIINYYNMNEAEQEEDPRLAYSSTLNRRLAIFTLKALKSPIEIRYRNGKIATGVLHSIDPCTFDMVVSNYNYAGEKEKEKERGEFRHIKFGEIVGFHVFASNVDSPGDKEKEIEGKK